MPNAIAHTFTQVCRVGGEVGCFSAVCGWMVRFRVVLLSSSPLTRCFHRVTLLGFLGGVASIALQCMQSLVAMNMIAHSGDPASSGTQTQQWAIAEAILFTGFLGSLLPTRHIEKISKFLLGLIFFGVTLIVRALRFPAETHISFPATDASPGGRASPLRSSLFLPQRKITSPRATSSAGGTSACAPLFSRCT